MGMQGKQAALGRPSKGQGECMKKRQSSRQRVQYSKQEEAGWARVLTGVWRT